MVSSFFSLHIVYVTFLILFSVAFSSSNVNKHEVCSSSLYSCGQLRNIEYPFWGQNRPDYCGRKEFLLSCNSADNSTSIFSYRARKASFQYYVNGLNASSHTMVISRYKFQDSLCLHDKNLRWGLPPTMKADATSSSNISLFYGCPKCWKSKYQSRSFNCSNLDGTEGSGYYFDEPSKVRVNESRACNYSVTIPVNKTGLIKLNKKNPLSILYQGLEVEYLANLSACATCLDSGGRCGSEPSSVKFLCYCPDGSEALICPKSGSVCPRRTSLVLNFESESVCKQ